MKDINQPNIILGILVKLVNVTFAQKDLDIRMNRNSVKTTIFQNSFSLESLVDFSLKNYARKVHEVKYSLKCLICENIYMKNASSPYMYFMLISVFHSDIPFVTTFLFKIMLKSFRKWMKIHLSVPFVKTFIWKMPHHHTCTSCTYK